MSFKNGDIAASFKSANGTPKYLGRMYCDSTTVAISNSTTLTTGGSLAFTIPAGAALLLSASVAVKVYSGATSALAVADAPAKGFPVAISTAGPPAWFPILSSENALAFVLAAAGTGTVDVWELKL